MNDGQRLISKYINIYKIYKNEQKLLKEIKSNKKYNKNS